jgi:hypothetical protein
VRPAGFGPLPRERGEVTAVACDEDALLIRCELQNVPVRKRSLAGQRTHVVFAAAKRLADPARRELVIEQEPHLAVRERRPDEGIELEQLLDGAVVLSDRLVDLLRVGLVVGLGDLDVPMLDVWKVLHDRLGRAVVP